MTGVSAADPAGAGPGEAPRVGVALSLEDVWLTLGATAVLRGVTAAVRPGQLVAVIGANGAGKTSLLRVILGLLRPSRGAVLLGGTPVRRGSSRIGYVPQSFVPDVDLPLRGRDLVALGVDGERWGVPIGGRARAAKVEAMLERVDARTYADAPIGTLSGGERQRLLVAHALVSDPTVLLLDEPFSSLDMRSTHGIVALVRELTTERAVATLLVAHDINPLIGAADAVLYLARGRAAMGPVDEVVRSDVLSALFGYRVDVLRVRDRILVAAGEDRAAYDPAAGDLHH